MKTLNDYFEKIVCINLDKRQDRWDKVIDECSKHSIKIERFSAIDGDFLSSRSYLKQGELGCALSHLKIIEKAKNENLKNILILEDDVEFDADVNKKFFDYIVNLPEWDFLYLGANHALNNKCMSASESPVKVSENIYKLKEAYSMHCYAVQCSFFDKVLNFQNNLHAPIDVLYSQLHKQSRSYVIYPSLAWQAEGFSDIQKKYVDYDFLKK